MERHDRIAKAIAASGKKKGEIAAACGVANSSVTQWISGQSKSLRPENLYALAKATGYRAEWLAIGEGAETTEQSNVAMVAQPDLMYRYPVISWVVASVSAQNPSLLATSDRYEMSEYKSKGPAFWLEVAGDSMTSPVGQSVPEGTLILVDTAAAAHTGNLVIARLGHSSEATFKKLVEDGGRTFLKPLNPAYPIEQCSHDCQVIGVVVRGLMKF